MKGILVKSLALMVILSGSVVAQGLPVYNQGYLQSYGSMLMMAYPAARDFNGGGVRARGMGNAFIGVSDDASAVSWNPAGLYRQDNQYEQPVISLSYQSLSSDAGFSSKPFTEFDSKQFDFDDVANDVNFMSIVLPIRLKGHMFVGSLAYSRLGDEVYNSGMGFDVMMPFDAPDSLDGIDRQFTYQVETNYRSAVNVLNIGFGTRLYNNWSFGLSVNAYGGKAAEAIEETVTWEDAIIPGASNDQRGTYIIANDTWDTTSFSGVYFTLGFKYTSERLSAGLIIKTPHTLKESIDVLIENQGYANGNEWGADVTVHRDDNIVELDQPMILGAGVGYKVTEKLLLAVDVEYRPYEGGMVNRRDSLQLVPGGTDIEYFTEYDPFWENTWAFRTGAEYVWETGSQLFPIVPLRAGFGYVQLPAPNVDDYTVDDLLNVVPVTSKTAITKWSLGTGVRWAQIDLDFAYEKSTGDLENSVFVQKWSTDNSAFSVMFTGYF
ncbi:MAG: hypothetical protein J7J98_03570 [candidate division Zixibacteria bacterium]|nr:hypothetical protein [candidate division Zixibacteria bacterium]